jgi:ribulose-5-phosphate 4-epimerase/fuculose-1-phosphate aldolase
MSADQAERQARIDLAAVYRATSYLGLDAGTNNHHTLMLPGSDRLFLSHRYGLHFSEVTASGLVVIDGLGNAVDGEGVAERTAYHIHWSIHRARPDARCVLHTHQPYATALGMVENGRLEMAFQDCLRFHDRIAYYDRFDGVEVDEAEGARIVAALGDKDVLLLRHHGVVVCGPTVGEAFDDMFFLETACRAVLLARQFGRVVTVPEAVAAETGRTYERHPEWKEIHFAAMKRVLDRDMPGYER